MTDYPYKYSYSKHILPAFHVAQGEQRCGAKGKSVAPAQTAGRTMLKAWAFPREGIIKGSAYMLIVDCVKAETHCAMQRLVMAFDGLKKVSFIE